MSLLIFTGLDRMLLPIEDYDYEPVARVVEGLQQQNIPLIPVTNNTRAEVENLSQKIGFKDPLIVEHGSGIFIPQDHKNFQVSETEIVDNYHLHQLGCTYTEARAALKVVQEESNKILRGFGDLDEENIQSMMGLSLAAVRRAKAREFSEYFVTPNRIEIAQLQEVATEYGFKIVPGDRLSLIMGGKAERGQAIALLKENYQTAESEIVTVGLGSTKQDLPLLEAVDIPMVIPTSDGVEPSFGDREWQIATTTGSSGWIEAIKKVSLN